MDDHIDDLLRALADRTRRALLDRLRDTPGLTLNELLEGFAQTRQALSKHLAVLEEAELVVPVWRGREKRHYLNPTPLQSLPARWVTESQKEDAVALTTMRAASVTIPDGSSQQLIRKERVSRNTKNSAQNDPLTQALLAPPASELQGQPILRESGLLVARAYLEQTAASVQQLIEAMKPDEGYAKPSADRFSLVEHLWHLADVETLGWSARFDRILHEEKPKLEGVDGDRLAREKRYQEQPWRAAAKRFVTARRNTLKSLARFETKTLLRPVVFAGARTRAGGVLAAAVAHDLDHRPEMAALWNEIAASNQMKGKKRK